MESNQLEIWKPIKEFSNYSVSNLGNVKNTVKDKILKPTIDRKGYCSVKLYKNNGKIKKIFKVHRLVAEAFINNYNELPQINHINEIKLDNRAVNLEWCDNNYNCNYGSHSLKLMRAVAQYDKQGNLLNNWVSITDASIYTGVCLCNIARCCKNQRKTAGGFIWKFI